MSDELIQQRRWMMLGVLVYEAAWASVLVGVIGIVVALHWLPGRPAPIRSAADSEPVAQEHEAPVLIEA